MALGVDLVRSGVNLAEDAARLAKSKNSITRSFDTMRALVAPRPGFVATAKTDARAVNEAGFLMDGYIRNTKNPATGMSERIFYSGDIVERVLYDGAKKPVGAIHARFSPIGNVDSLYSQVLKPSEDGKVVEVLANGTEKPSNYFGVTDFAKAFDIKNIQAFVKDLFKM